MITLDEETKVAIRTASVDIQKIVQRRMNLANAEIEAKTGTRIESKVVALDSLIELIMSQYLRGVEPRHPVLHHLSLVPDVELVVSGADACERTGKEKS